MDFKEDEYYVVSGGQLNRLVAVAKRLYTESRMYGDEMRDTAQIIYEGVLPSVEGPVDLDKL
jgi:hypothetical protein